jgi:drug/metabolite transporter (DMT)-like permease
MIVNRYCFVIDYDANYIFPIERLEWHMLGRVYFRVNEEKLMSITRNQRADLFMLFITLIWSGTFVIIKNALDDVPPFLYTGLRFALASLIGYALWFRSIHGITKKELWQGSVLGLFFGLGFLSQTWGLQHTSVANSSFITGSMAIFTPIAAFLIDGRTVTKYQAIGIFTVLLGLAFFSQHGLDDWQFNIGDMATLFCAVMWGMYITYTDTFMRDAEDIAASSARLTFIQFIISCIFAFAGSLLLEGPISEMPNLIQHAFASSDFWVALLYTAILASIVATYIQTRYQHETSPVKAALMFSTEPVTATLLAVMVGVETLSIEKFFIGAIVICGVLIAQAEDIFPSLKTDNQDS